MLVSQNIQKPLQSCTYISHCNSSSRVRLQMAPKSMQCASVSLSSFSLVVSAFTSRKSRFFSHILIYIRKWWAISSSNNVIILTSENAKSLSLNPLIQSILVSSMLIFMSVKWLEIGTRDPKIVRHARRTLLSTSLAVSPSSNYNHCALVYLYHVQSWHM